MFIMYKYLNIHDKHIYISYHSTYSDVIDDPSNNVTKQPGVDFSNPPTQVTPPKATKRLRNFKQRSEMNISWIASMYGVRIFSYILP